MTSRSERRDPACRVLLTGATGYVGGRLLRALEDRGHRVRCLARKPEHLASRIAPQTEVVAGDVVSGESLTEALSGVEAAYYLVHSMGSAGGFEGRDRRAARNFGAAARAAGVRRIVYLGGLADERQELSPHLRSRLEVGRLLRDSGVPVIELRASIVIGSGSLSFEMIRALVEHLPVLVTPRWVSMPAQPIGIDDLIAYLLEALGADATGSPIYEIGGADRMSYADLMREYARQRGLRRLMLPVPVLTPRLSSLWLGLVTPLYARVGRKLIDSIRHPTVVRNDAARRAFRVVPSDVRTAIARALENEDREFAETRWSDALSASGGAPPPFGGVRIGRRLVDSREVELPVPARRAFAAVRRIGGRTGWYAHDWLWQLRGFLDLLVGGAGMRRGRRDPDQAAVGDTIDCWRVTGFAPDRSLRLAAEMRLPGRAWLEFEVSPFEGGSRLRQTAVFQPSGLAGLAYWYGIYPLHALVFRGMLRGVAKAALDAETPSAPRTPLGRIKGRNAGVAEGIEPCGPISRPRDRRKGIWGMQHRVIVALVLAVSCLGAPRALGAEIAGVEFRDQYRWNGAKLRLNGTGLLRYRVFIKGYAAALYLGERIAPERALDDVPRRLEIEYFWSIPAKAFAEITLEGMARSLDAAALERLRGRIERLGALYRDVEPGDRYSLTYVPGIGTELALNGEPVGVIEGADFSSALFAIWIGERALDESLREQLLARG